MKIVITAFLWLVFAFCAVSVFGQEEYKVANFSTGSRAGKNFEHLEFYADARGRGRIVYSYRDGKEIELTYLGVETAADKQKVFKVQFPNDLILIVAPSGDALKVTDEKGTYLKYFRWQYVGPVNGIGTWCDQCTEDEKEAINLVKTYFLK